MRIDEMAAFWQARVFNQPREPDQERGCGMTGPGRYRPNIALDGGRGTSIAACGPELGVRSF